MDILNSIWDFLIKVSVVLVAVGGIDFWLAKIFGQSNGFGFLGAVYAFYIIYYFSSKKEG